MWIIFAGISILMTVIFVFNDAYCSQTYCNNQQKHLNVALHNNNDSQQKLSHKVSKF